MTGTLLADIGGTNIRFGLLRRAGVEKPIVYPHEKGLSAEKAIERYLAETGGQPDSFVAGAAGVLSAKGRIALTNRKFILDMPALCRRFGFQTGVLANDMAFHAISVVGLPDTRYACVVFVGTGMGVAYIQDGVVYPTEDGHKKIPHPTKEERQLKAKYWEDLISGPAFLQIYQGMEGAHKPVLQSREVSYLAHNIRDKDAIQTYQVIARCLAAFCIQIARTRKVSVFFLGGKIVEVLRLPVAQETFFRALGKWGDVLRIRIMKPGDPTGMKGLSVIAKEVLKTGTTNQIAEKAVYIYRAPVR